MLLLPNHCSTTLFHVTCSKEFPVVHKTETTLKLAYRKLSNEGALPKWAHPLWKVSSRAFQRYMTCLYSPKYGLSYIVGKLLSSAFRIRAKPFWVWAHCALIGELMVCMSALDVMGGFVVLSHPVPGMTRLGVESRASPSRVGASLDR